MAGDAAETAFTGERIGERQKEDVDSRASLREQQLAVR
jgi:hypothetical protein